MKKYLCLFITCCIIFLGCTNSSKDVELDETVTIIETTSIETYKWKSEKEVICYLSDNNGSILFSDGSVYSFSDITDKSTVLYNNISLVLIPIKPFLIITYDDTPASDYDIYKIHKLYEPIVPAEIGIIVGGHALSNEKMVEMVNEGNWEVVHHSYSHSRLERVQLQKKHLSGTDKIYGWFVHTFINGVEITIGDDTYKVVSHGTDGDGKYITVLPSLMRDYPITTVLKLSDRQLERELFEGVEEFEKETGINIKNFTYPYTVFDSRTVDLLKTKYISSRAYNGTLSNKKNLTNPGMNYFPFDNKYSLNSADFIIDYTEEEILSVLAKAKESKAVLMQFSHTWDTNFSKTKLVFLIDNAKKAGFKITTRSKLWEYYEFL